MSHFEPVKNAAEIGVLGAGRLGTTLALALVRAGHAVRAVASREPNRAAALAAGALRGCFHPLQTFPDRFADPARLRAITIGIEGDGELDAELRALCRELGATPLSLAGVDRARYHAAAVFASNYVVALHAA